MDTLGSFPDYRDQSTSYPSQSKLSLLVTSTQDIVAPYRDGDHGAVCEGCHHDLLEDVFLSGRGISWWLICSMDGVWDSSGDMGPSSHLHPFLALCLSSLWLYYQRTDQVPSTWWLGLPLPRSPRCEGQLEA